MVKFEQTMAGWAVLVNGVKIGYVSSIQTGLLLDPEAAAQGIFISVLDLAVIAAKIKGGTCNGHQRGENGIS